MRKPSLSRWLKREILILSGLERFNLRKLAAMAQGSHARLAEPLFLYCLEAGQVERLYELAYLPDVLNSWNAAEEALCGKDLTQLALSGTASEVVPREYSKHLESFAVCYRKPETVADSKRMRLERCRDLRLRTGASITDISHALGLDAGNVSAFLKNGDLGRITLTDATAMMKYLMSL
jgi:hypothetical protein